MRGATPSIHAVFPTHSISIHTPHAGSDRTSAGTPFQLGDFNPHSPCGERRAEVKPVQPAQPFQSTLPMRGATLARSSLCIYFIISIHTPHAGSDDAILLMYIPPDYISIHTPHAGSDAMLEQAILMGWNFNPHSPCGERPKPCLS